MYLLIQLYGYKEYNQICPLNPSTSTCYGGNIFMLIVNGILVNGPYCLITTSVSADLGTHPSLQGTQNSNDNKKLPIIVEFGIWIFR